MTVESPGLVAKGVDLKSGGCEFESRRRILDGDFCSKISIICLKRPKNEKDAEDGPFKKLREYLAASSSV